MPEHAWITALRRLGHPSVAVVGDFMLDRYLWGDALRVSPEAPVPVVHTSGEEERAGGAGNVAANVCEMEAVAGCFGFLGEDAHAARLKEMLAQQGAQTDGLIGVAERPTTQKVRIMARSQQMLRVDHEDVRAYRQEQEDALLERLRAASWSAVVLSDYGKGCLSERLIGRILQEARERDATSLVDPKRRDFGAYRGASLITPNRVEAEDAAGASLRSFEELAERGEALRRQAELEALLITLGAEGMYFLRSGHDPLHVPTAARAVYDVTGAGDTVISTMAVARAAGVDWETAVGLANTTAGLVVAKVGTATVGRTELLHHLHAATSGLKKIDAGAEEALQATIAAFRREGQRIVFTNGCFDILHAGHVRYLQEARRLGDVLVVGLNDDASVRRLKGEERPFNILADRMEILAALECVDLVVPFAEDTPEALIRKVGPDVLVKGADWKEKGVVGADYVEARGGEVRLIDLVPGRSTTGLAERIRGS